MSIPRRQVFVWILSAAVAGTVQARGDDEGSCYVPPSPPVQVESLAPAVRACLGFPSPKKVRSVLDLQLFKKSQYAMSPNGTIVELQDLNPNVGAWYLLKIKFVDGTSREFHLEVASAPTGARPKLRLTEDGIQVGAAADSDSEKNLCRLWDAKAPLATANLSDELLSKNPPMPFVSLCQGRLFVRVQLAGGESGIGRVANKLRGGPLGYVSTMVKTVPGVANRPEDVAASSGEVPKLAPQLGQPAAALLDPAQASQSLVRRDSTSLGIQTQEEDKELVQGRWYPVKDNAGVFVSIMRSGMTTPEIRHSFSDRVDDPGVEEKSLVYLTAFDLSNYSVAYVLGTDQPNPQWGAAPQGIPVFSKPEGPFVKLAEERNASPGPDGIGSAAPLVTNGIVPPYEIPRLVSTFNAGYQRYDMSMVNGPLSKKNHSSHWGFVQNGVVVSKLQPGLATAVAYTDGSFDLLTWPENDKALLPRIKDARQNGVAVIDGYDKKKQQSIPGQYVGGKDYYSGGWASGEYDSRIRSGLCIQEVGGKRYLLFGYFPSARPSSMARLFQAYGCSYAMQLDINLSRASRLPIFEHAADGSIKDAQFLHQYVGGVAASGGLEFVNVNDYRDFFYVIRK